MRIRKMLALMGTVTVIGACLLLYAAMDRTLLPQTSSNYNKEVQKSMWSNLKDRLENLEGDIKRNKETVDEIKTLISSLVEKQQQQQNKIKQYTIINNNEHNTNKNHFNNNVHDLSNRNIYMTNDKENIQRYGQCPARATDTDINMLNLYKSIPFDNPDGGVWKQGWTIDYNSLQWSSHKKLKIFLVPHSHNDPGWIKTFEDYYQSQTRSILNNLIKKLAEDERRKFVWAEISYLQLWWTEQTNESRERLKKLLKNGQLEIVTGGWVMTDEANAHYWSMLHQLTEGHEWLEENIGYKPRYGWSIDPFGYSATMPYILKKSNFSATLIQRVHYSVKKRLAKDKNLEFRWRQTWGDSSLDLLTHLMPFYSYDIPHTCGPDPKVCCQFDFKRLPGSGVNCPWRLPPQKITPENVAPRAELLLDQYRKKAQLYSTNVLLIPLGDDFRYDHETEWDAQYNNYQALFDHMNSMPELNVEAKFGTLSDYFNALKKEKEENKFPSLSGDFFTYADRDEHYWSGYFTSRPYYKRLDRILIGYLRAAEIIFSLSWAQAKAIQGRHPWLLTPQSGIMSLINEARQANALFQHHDGVTGTAKDHVVIDYGKKMLKAIDAAQHVIQQCTQFLLTSQTDSQLDPEFWYFHLDDKRPRPGTLPERTKITFGEGLFSKQIVIYNSLTRHRTDVIRVRVAQYNVKVTDWKNRIIPSQVQPLFDEGESMKDLEYELLFLVEVSPLSLSTYTISWVSPQEKNSLSALASVTFANHMGESTLHKADGFDNINILQPGEDFSIATSYLQATFSTGGLLKAVTLLTAPTGPETIPIKLDFAAYGAKNSKERSGAYLFLPDGPAKIVAPGNTPLVRILNGPLASQVEVRLPFITHRVTIYNVTGEKGHLVEIENLVELFERPNTELSMRFSTNIQNADTFYTDLNAFQMVPRIRFSKLPLQAHFYPLSGMAHLEDSKYRMTITSGSPLGVTSLKEGQLEIMQDRRLIQDDNRGLGQGVTDNAPTPHTFTLHLEQKFKDCDKPENEPPQPTLAAQLGLQSILYPLIRLISANDPHITLNSRYSLHQNIETEKWGCGSHIVTLRTRKAQTHPQAGLILHQMNWDNCFSSPPNLKCKPEPQSMVNVTEIFPGLFGNKIQRTSLTFLDNEGPLTSISNPQSVCPMNLAAFILGS